MSTYRERLQARLERSQEDAEYALLRERAGMPFDVETDTPFDVAAAAWNTGMAVNAAMMGLAPRYEPW